ncbi:uncharacterized protein LAESUDRAFT_665990 [Laetiporus sulphureus 93-53]|uniref:UbiA prenyltransferase n=1 Tax=Laetiporus sulphureus 93-53 TaxID=1314785 RepID=A0A165B8X3_9APHY|nr:uncharacterized protein LAESUDRAFT_665990 [Laetiporus sulphureus 93-53]KZT00514.1 hypothetical protein LAESUDRAFT_665990 [Laetiporus sulphureus 93-53]
MGTLLYHICTVFLFTKSDFKTTLIPVTVLAMAVSPTLEVTRVVHSIMWTWIHLLQFDVSNQSLNIQEDEINKPWRPLPAKRVSMRAARVVHWLLVPCCFTLSWSHGTDVLLASVALVFMSLLYNELHLHGRWLARNLLNAAGTAAFEVGATLVAAGGIHRLDCTAFMSVCLSAAIIASTIHAQDFKDIRGDQLVNRITIPLLFPSVARWTMLPSLTIWTMVLIQVWRITWSIGIRLLIGAIALGYRFLAFKTIRNDQASYVWYNVWLSLAHILPVYYRIRRQ